MTTNELIEALKNADPSGTHPVCINGTFDIAGIAIMPCYYDGFLEKFEKCSAGNIVGAKVIGTGKKVAIMQKSIQEALRDNPDLPINYDDLHDMSRVHYQKLHSDWREESRRIESQFRYPIRDE
jgi:hypothetical protein